MEKVSGFIRRYALAVTLLLTAASSAVSVDAVIQVQDERNAAVLRACEDDSARHDATIRELGIELKRAERGKSAAQRAQIEASRQFTVLLIDQLAPKRDCRLVLARSKSTSIQ